MASVGRRMSLAGRKLSLSTRALVVGASAARAKGGANGSGLCDYRGVSVNFLQEFAARVASGELALNVKLFVFLQDFPVPGRPDCVITRGTTAMRKRKLADTKYVMLVPGLGDVLIDSTLVAFKDRLDWNLDDVCEYIVKRNALLKRDSLIFNTVVERKHPEALGRPFQGSYVSAARTSKLAELVPCLEGQFKGRNLRKTFVWLDIFGANQSTVLLNDASMQDDEERGEIARIRLQFMKGEQLSVLKRFSQCILFMPSLVNPAPLTRAWCLWELYAVSVHETKLVVLLGDMGDDYGRLARLLDEGFDTIHQGTEDLDVSEARCSSPRDHELLLRAVRDQASVDSVNDGARRVVRTWLLASCEEAARAQRRKLKHYQMDGIERMVRLFRFQAMLLDQLGRTPLLDALARELNTAARKLQAANLPLVLQANSEIEILRTSRGLKPKPAKKGNGRWRSQRGAGSGRRTSPVDALQKIPSNRSSSGTASTMSTDVGSTRGSVRDVDAPRGNAGGGGRGSGSGRGHLAASEPSLQELTAAHEAETLRRASKQAAVSLYNEGMELHKSGRPVKALERLEEALRAFREDGSDANQSLHALTLIKIASILADKECFAAAIDRLREALDIQREALGQHSPDSAQTASRIAALLIKIGEFEEALDMYHDALTVHYQNGAKEHVFDIATVQRGLGLARTHLCDFEDAIDHYETALELLMDAFGAKHASVAETLSAMAITMQLQGSFEDAAGVARHALEVRRQLCGGGADDEAVADAHNNLAVILDEQGHHQDALEQYQAALKIFVKNFGDDHVRVGDMLYNIGNVLLSCDRLEEALAAFERALQIFSDCDSSNVGLALNNVALTLERQGRLDEALFAWKEAYAFFDEHSGSDHPHTERLRKRVEKVKHRRSRKLSRQSSTLSASSSKPDTPSGAQQRRRSAHQDQEDDQPPAAAQRPPTRTRRKSAFARALRA